MELDLEDQSIYSDPQKLFAALSQRKNSKIPMPTFLTFSEAHNQATERVKAIFDDRSSLLEILNRYDVYLFSCNVYRSWQCLNSMSSFKKLPL